MGNNIEGNTQNYFQPKTNTSSNILNLERKKSLLETHEKGFRVIFLILLFRLQKRLEERL